ncbi:hypothetical protein CALCODRAFT_403207, partial [Calocera cornea HHB12733]
LIVVVGPVVQQWKREIESKTKPVLSCMILGGTRPKNLSRELMKHNIVIATFNRVRLCFKADLHPLFSVKWHQIVLDESQEIRNPITQTTQAVLKLSGKHRW